MVSKALYKTVAGFLKLLQPSGECSDTEFDEWRMLSKAGAASRSRLDKRKQDDDFAQIHLGFRSHVGEFVEVHCPQIPGRRRQHRSAPRFCCVARRK